MQNVYVVLSNVMLTFYETFYVTLHARHSAVVRHVTCYWQRLS
jgi:hypothetical protein